MQCLLHIKIVILWKFNHNIGVDEVDFSRYPDKEYQLKWLRTYLEEWNQYNNITSPVTDDEVEKWYKQVNKCALVSINKASPSGWERFFQMGHFQHLLQVFNMLMGHLLTFYIKSCNFNGHMTLAPAFPYHCSLGLQMGN